MAWGGLPGLDTGLDTGTIPVLALAFRKHALHRFHDINLRLQQGGFT